MIEVRRNSAAVLAARKSVRGGAVTQRRQEIEGGSAVINGMPIWIDTVSQGKLTALSVAAQKNPALVVPWKGSDGTFYELDAPTFTALADTALAFVQALFARERELLAAIDAAEDAAALDLIDITAGWPGQET